MTATTHKLRLSKLWSRFRVLGQLEKVTAVVGLCYLGLLVFNPCIDGRLYHLLEFFQELLALAILVLLFEHYKERKSEREKFKNIRHAIAWLIDPNGMQINARAWLAKAKGKDGVPNGPMPFSEIKEFYYRILLLGVDMPDFVEFSPEMKSLKNALQASKEWDQFCSIRVGSVNKYSRQMDPVLASVESAAEEMKNAWAHYSKSSLDGKGFTDLREQPVRTCYDLSWPKR